MIIVNYIIDFTHINKYLLEMAKYEHDIKDNIYYGSMYSNSDSTEEENSEDSNVISLNSSDDTMYDSSTLDTYNFLEN